MLCRIHSRPNRGFGELGKTCHKELRLRYGHWRMRPLARSCPKSLRRWELERSNWRTAVVSKDFCASRLPWKERWTLLHSAAGALIASLSKNEVVKRHFEFKINVPLKF